MTDALWSAMEATWPAAQRLRAGPWLVREGQGGGGRVSSITAEDAWTEADIPAAEAAARDFGQPAVFMIRPGDDPLDAALAALGYAVKDPVLVMTADLAKLPDPDCEFVSFPHWPPLAVTRDIWAENGIGAARLAVMARAAAPKAALLGRCQDRPAGAAFVALSEGIAMLHALDVANAFRRRGLGRDMVRSAAHWARAAGASQLALLVTKANTPARALYTGMGFTLASAYHYRVLS